MAHADESQHVFIVHLSFFFNSICVFPLQPNPAAYELLEKRKRRDSVESHTRSAVGVNADAYVHRRLAGASHKSARPPNVSLLNSLNHPPLSQSQQPPHISSTAQPSSSKTPQLATFNKPRLRSSHRNLPKVSSLCVFITFLCVGMTIGYLCATQTCH